MTHYNLTKKSMKHLITDTVIPAVWLITMFGILTVTMVVNGLFWGGAF